MYILDTDHLTILQRGRQLAQQLKYKLKVHKLYQPALALMREVDQGIYETLL